MNSFKKIIKNIKPIIFNFISLIFAFLLLHQNTFAQLQLELANQSYSGAPNGLTTSNQQAVLLKNTTGSTFSNIIPNITVTATLTNQQFNNISTTRVSTGRGMSFGGRVNSITPNAVSVPTFNSINSIDLPSNHLFTSSPNGPLSTGINIVDNFGFYLFNSVDELFTTNAPLNGRYYYGDLTLTFNQPVSNPIIHFSGLGSNVTFGPSNKQGITTEFELQNNSVTLSKMSGSNEFSINSNKVLNNAATPTINCGSGAACGSVLVSGTNITSLNFRVYVRGDGNGQAWSHSAIAAGDELIISVSMNAPVIISGNVFNDSNGLTDNLVNGVGTNINGSLFINLIDSLNKVVAVVPVANDGTYLINNVAEGNYTLVLSIAQGVQGMNAPTAILPSGWINTGESSNIGIGNDGLVNGILPINVSVNDISNLNFGIYNCGVAVPTISANQNTVSCLGTGLTLTSTVAPSYQWYKDGVAILGATSQSYVPVVSGTYTMHIILSGGICNVSSNSIPVVINYAATPSIATTFDTVNICLKNNENICPAVWGFSNYQWYREGVLIPAPQGTSSCLYPNLSGNYSLTAQNGAGCWSLPSTSVYVKIDTICSIDSGIVSSGGFGGVESKSLGDIIATRLYGNAINSINPNDYKKSNYSSSGIVVNGINDITLKSLIPNKLLGIDSAFDVSPVSLVNFTNATEVLAVDYIKNNQLKAVVFSTKTLQDVYSHTKPICDRLKGAELLQIKHVFVKGYKLLAYKLKQDDGKIEYAINLSAGVNSNRNTITLQSNWFTDSYTKEESLFNFQIWSVSYNTSVLIAEKIINNLEQNASLTYIDNEDLPKVYVKKGNRKNQDLNLTILNNTNNTSGYLVLKEKVNENSLISTRKLPINLKAFGLTNISVNVADYYETNIYMYVNDTLKDLVYLSDGNWNVNYNKQTTTLNSFKVFNETNGLQQSKDEHRLFRNVEIKAVTKDYVSVYKTLMGGGLSQNVQQFDNLVFNANTIGVSEIKVTLIKKSISQWNNQYTYTVKILGNREYVIPLKDFVSNTNEPLEANDITAVNFSCINSRGTVAPMEINLSQVRFGKPSSLNLQDGSLNISLYPNPNKGNFTLSFNSSVKQNLILKVIEASTGREIHLQNTRAEKGINSINLSLQTKLQNGTYVLILEGDGVKYNPTKFVIHH